MSKRWYTIYTRENCEKKVIAFLKSHEIPSYCPMNKIIRNGIFKNRVVTYKPLFKDYVFAFIEDKKLYLINECKQINNFVYWLGRPVIINEFEISNLKKFVELNHDIQLEKIPVKLNRLSSMTDSLFKYNYTDETINDQNEKNTLTLHSLGFRLLSKINDCEYHIPEVEYNVVKMSY